MLEVKQETEEQIKQEQARQGELHKSISDKLKGDNIQDEILKDLGLSPEVESKQVVRKSIQEEESEQEEEEIKEEESSDESEEVESSEEQNEEEEEVIPKSKVQKRFDELTARLKAQEKQIEELTAKRESPKDEITKQLESMSQAELKAAKIEVRKAQIKAQDDDARLNELLALEDKIDSVMQEAPKNFVKAQQEAYMKKAAKIAESGDIPNMEKVAPQILKLANEIYSEYPLLQKDVNGQATALELAVKHFKAISSTPGDKTKEVELKRQNNNLKRKVTLDTKGGKVNADKARLDTLRKSAINGTIQQKVDLVKSHPMFNVSKMIPDEFKQ